MRHSRTHTTFAVIAFLFALQWTSAARADVTITGTVGEIGAIANLPNSNSMIRFKLTDATQTQTCNGSTQAGSQNVGMGYAWFYGATGYASDSLSHEWYAILLVSKKGASISCTIDTSTNCHVTSCTLP